MARYDEIAVRVYYAGHTEGREPTEEDRMAEPARPLVEPAQPPPDRLCVASRAGRNLRHARTLPTRTTIRAHRIRSPAHDAPRGPLPRQRVGFRW
ncbi:hypothetical protein EHYA_10007 [Embleya hyalina]|uniref:Uncharacterized protein n=1 Tax=Embleya hyalina TaxID=516124 RepID=A0A401Z5U0_9ACTN|nr:hypothetical protein EHYA_10007 [Embleya hyalina]